MCSSRLRSRAEMAGAAISPPLKTSSGPCGSTTGSRKAAWHNPGPDNVQSSLEKQSAAARRVLSLPSRTSPTSPGIWRKTCTTRESKTRRRSVKASRQSARIGACRAVKPTRSRRKNSSVAVGSGRTGRYAGQAGPDQLSAGRRIVRISEGETLASDKKPYRHKGAYPESGCATFHLSVDWPPG